MSSDSIIKLNIGGTIFQTTKATLSKFNGMFKVMMETDIPVAKDESGAIFIDRSPKHFDSILNYLRDGNIVLPESRKKEVKEIEKEAHFYLLDGLVELCNQKISEKSENSHKKLLKTIDCDSDLLQIIVDPIKQYEHKMDVYFKPYETGRSARCLEWQWTFYRKNYAEGNLQRDPRQTFGQQLEASLKFFFTDFPDFQI
ncbi:hypothetical protein GCK72_008119 [Caenorhabditis remanei]|uniref:BTB domain-containing protein n=1 Tax=Caenorhabditis remanei TaxID=31234 RepID=A0A6A5HPC7_CAERE|nr:hypothetical protein GCK72_008119 [Caenorhabditis remanei]KAF1768157.1 hypothetical protein GCK72_008119 [Caenorhabditis remanei]